MEVPRNKLRISRLVAESEYPVIAGITNHQVSSDICCPKDEHGPITAPQKKEPQVAALEVNREASSRGRNRSAKLRKPEQDEVNQMKLIKGKQESFS